MKTPERALKALKIVALYLEPWAGYYADVSSEYNGLRQYLKQQAKDTQRQRRSTGQRRQYAKRVRA